MATIRYLLDEQLPKALMLALLREEPAMEVLQVGINPAPPKGTLDPDLLKLAEANQLTLLSFDKSTLPGHVNDHLGAGLHTWGVFLLRDGLPLRDYVDDLLLMWSASQAADWQDVLDWLPWK